ncbi:MAG TPA: acyltransferase [Acidimicrobiia bacterium]|nr:acyltransferase [Acidimicrobiia bacterium]
MISPDAQVDERAVVAASARVWDLARVREDAVIGDNCVIGTGAYVDVGVRIGDNCKIQNHALVYAPAVLEDGVFVGPAAVLTNDTYPRAINPDGSLKTAAHWEMVGVTVRHGASIGARAVILGGVEVGEWALVAAGAVVTGNVAPYALMAGVPARRIGWVGRRGVPLTWSGDGWVDAESGDAYQEENGGLTPR